MECQFMNNVKFNDPLCQNCKNFVDCEQKNIKEALSKEKPRGKCFICQNIVNADEFLNRVVITVPITPEEKIERLKLDKNTDNLKCIVLCIDCAKHIKSELNSINIKEQNRIEFSEIEFPIIPIKAGLQPPDFPEVKSHG